METVTTRSIPESEVPADIRERAKKSHRPIAQDTEQVESSFRKTIMEIMVENQLTPEVEKCLEDAYYNNDITGIIYETGLSWKLRSRLMDAYYGK